MLRLSPRVATLADVPAVASVVNRAYEVERFFVTGDRVTPAALVADMQRGTIYVVDGDGNELQACVYVEIGESRGYFGMLAVHPDTQGRGLGRGIIEFAENAARASGAIVMTISVVNLREDLFAFYERLGYRVTGTAPYVHRPVIQPVHFLLMEKAL